jgi:hypothetical protein
MLTKMMSFSQLPAVTRHHFAKHDKQIFGPSYFVKALDACPRHLWIALLTFSHFKLYGNQINP